tara:strand:- start:498 stop:707 length:210 start_codon:yes stop_codon:yes gene_type:complete
MERRYQSIFQTMIYRISLLDHRKIDQVGRENYVIKKNAASAGTGKEWRFRSQSQGESDLNSSEMRIKSD